MASPTESKKRMAEDLRDGPEIEIRGGDHQISWIIPCGNHQQKRAKRQTPPDVDDDDEDRGGRRGGGGDAGTTPGTGLGTRAGLHALPRRPLGSTDWQIDCERGGEICSYAQHYEKLRNERSGGTEIQRDDGTPRPLPPGTNGGRRQRHPFD